MHYHRVVHQPQNIWFAYPILPASKVRHTTYQAFTIQCFAFVSLTLQASNRKANSYGRWLFLAIFFSPLSQTLNSPKLDTAYHSTEGTASINSGDFCLGFCLVFPLLVGYLEKPKSIFSYKFLKTESFIGELM